MNKRKETRYLDKHWKKMRKGLQSFLNTGDNEQLHLLRVEVKKLRAMIALLETVTRNWQLHKFFKPVRKVFKHAGEIRNTQINLQLAHEYKLNNSGFESARQNEMAQCTEEFKLKAPVYLKKLKHARRQIKNSLGSVKNKSIARFYKKQLKQIAGSLAVPHFDDELHNCRKQMKVLMYNHKLTGKALESRLNFNEDYIDQLQARIGNWHDHVLAIDLFASPGVEDRPVVEKIKEENLKTEKSITALSQDFLTKATAPAAENNKNQENG